MLVHCAPPHVQGLGTTWLVLLGVACTPCATPGPSLATLPSGMPWMTNLLRLAQLARPPFFLPVPLRFPATLLPTLVFSSPLSCQ